MATYIWNTEFGKALAAIIPEFTTRIIIDISLDDIVVAYYKTHAPNELLNLDWSEALSRAKVVCGDDKKFHLEIVEG